MIGKSFFAVNFVQFLKGKSIPHVAIDSDNENSTLKRFHPDARFLDLNHPREIDGIFSGLDQARLTVVGCRAASTDLFLDYFAEIDLETVLSALGVSLTLVMPVNHELDSVDQVQLRPRRRFLTAERYPPRKDNRWEGATSQIRGTLQKQIDCR